MLQAYLVRHWCLVLYWYDLSGIPIWSRWGIPHQGTQLLFYTQDTWIVLSLQQVALWKMTNWLWHQFPISCRKNHHISYMICEVHWPCTLWLHSVIDGSTRDRAQSVISGQNPNGNSWHLHKFHALEWAELDFNLSRLLAPEQVGYFYK